MTLVETERKAVLSLVGRLMEQIDAAVRPLLHGSRRIALVDYPAHRNVGDSAIWLGELAYLRKLGLPRPVYTCDWSTYSRKEMRRRLEDGVILLSGGGNFGDLWRTHQTLRERVIRDFPDNPIVQLPQSIHFEQEERLENAAGVVGGHKQFTLLVRDRRSYDLAQARMSASIRLCPDMAFCLGRITPVGRPSHPLLFLSRTDKERAIDLHAQTPGGPLRADWRDDKGDPLVVLQHHVRRLFRSRPAYVGPVAFRLDSLIARRRLNYGRKLLSSGRVVITDRLHGHILCLLMGIPHIVLDNSYGKVSGFMESWTGDSSVVRRADSFSEAVEIARSLDERENNG